MEKKKLIQVDNLRQYFPVKKSSFLQKEQLYVKANDGITINIYEGETYGLVGESGCGKSTLGRVLLQLYVQTRGDSIYYGRDVYQYQPKYYAKDLDRLSTYQDKYKKAVEKWNAHKNEDKNHQYHDEVKKQWNHLCRLSGGFALSDNVSSFANILKEEYSAGCKVADLIGNNASDSEIESAKKAHEDIKIKIEEMKKPFTSQEDFAEADAMWEHGIDLTRLSKEEMRILREDLQIIFQDPYSSLNPRLTVGQIISEPLVGQKKFKKGSKELEEYIMQVMANCGLESYFIHRYPHQFSGGQRQRIGIARALALNPKFIVCDEAVSALDVSIQSQVLNLLQELKEKQGLTYLFISHDLSVVKYISDLIGVM